MHELFRRLFQSKPLAIEVVVASFFVNILFLASPIFVIQILSRYIAYGFDGTLYTLTGGMLIALVLGMAFTLIRTRMCAALSAEPDRQLQASVLEALAQVKTVAFDRIPQARIQEVVAGPQVVQSAYEAARLASVLDMPFFLLFFFAVFFLSPILGILTLLAIVGTVVSGVMNIKSARDSDNELRDEIVRHRGGVTSAIQGAETVRAFQGRTYLQSLWQEQVDTVVRLKEKIIHKKSWALAIVQGVSSLLKVAIYAVGAKEVVNGDLTVGALIGASILSAKALQISSSFMQSALLMAKAEDTMKMINEFLRLPRESYSGTGMRQYSGKLEFLDVAIAFPGATGPLFESFSYAFEPGSVIGVVGANGAGKTTLSKMIVGLLEPGRGQILAGGVDLRQLAPEWWRKQVMYLPQEPSFLNGTFKDNITLLNPDIDESQLNEIVRLADLRKYLDTTSTGMDTVISDGGRSLPLGIRKRLALARALVAQGRVAVFDEPTEGLDSEGCEAIYQVLNVLAQQGVTLFIVSRDRNVVKGFSIVIDLDTKPTPRIETIQPNHSPAQSTVSGEKS